MGLLLFIMGNIQSQTDDTYELEIIHNGPGKIVLQNGDEISGFIEYTLTANNRLKLKKEGEDKSVKYNTTDLKSFNVNDLKFIRIKAFGLESFGLITNEHDSKIQIVELLTQFAVGKPSGDGFLHQTTRKYYAYFVKQDKVVAIDDVGFNNKKLADLTSDCPELSKKIADKSPDYKMGLSTTGAQKMEILKKVIEEYKKCN